MPITCTYPTSYDSFPKVAAQGDHTPLKPLADAVYALEVQRGLVPATASTPITLATAVTIYASQGSLRTIATVGIAVGSTITLSAAGATQGQKITIVKTANAATGTVTIDSIVFTTKKRFGAEFVFSGGAWRICGSTQYT